MVSAEFRATWAPRPLLFEAAHGNPHHPDTGRGACYHLGDSRYDSKISLMESPGDSRFFFRDR